MKKRFEVTILGQNLVVASDSGDEHVANVIRHVNEKVEEAGKAAGNKNPLNIAILAALNMADEHLRMLGKEEDVHIQLENRTEKLIHLINASR